MKKTFGHTQNSQRQSRTNKYRYDHGAAQLPSSVLYNLFKTNFLKKYDNTIDQNSPETDSSSSAPTLPPRAFALSGGVSFSREHGLVFTLLRRTNPLPGFRLAHVGTLAAVL